VLHGFELAVVEVAGQIQHWRNVLASVSARKPSVGNTAK